MKKIIILFTCMFILASCGQKKEKKEITKTDVIGIMYSGDISRCEELKNENEKINCKDNINYDNAVKLSDNTKCEILVNQETKSRCNDHIALNLAMSKNDKAQCLKIKSKTLKDWCKNQIILKSINSNSNIEICNDFIWVKQDCLNEYYNIQAKLLNDVQKCDWIINDYLKQNCKSNFDTVVSTDINIENTSSWSVSN